MLACASVAHWLVVPETADSEYRNVYHMIASIQGFLTCLLVGFCFFLLPRFTVLSFPKTWIWLVGLIAPVGTVLSAWLRFAAPDEIMLAVAMVFWGISVLALLLFVYPLLRTRKTESNPVYWILMGSALLFGCLGTALVSTYSTIQIVTLREIQSILLLGRGYLLQGMFLMVFLAGLPSVSSLNKPGAGVRHPDHPSVGFILTLVLLFTVSIPIEIFISGRAGFGLRSALLVTALLRAMPSKTSGNASFLLSIIRLSAWSIPVGYAIPVLAPDLRNAGLHIVFMTGFVMGFFAMIAFIGLALTPHLKSSCDRPRSAGWFPLLLVLATLIRIAADMVPADQLLWLRHSTIVFIGGILAWLYLLGRLLKRVE